MAKKFTKVSLEKLLEASIDDADGSSRSVHITEIDSETADRKKQYVMALPNTAPSTPQLLMGEAIEHLQGRQKETYFLTMREGKSLSEVAKILGISKSAAQIYKLRAIKFIELYCKEAIARGRV